MNTSTLNALLLDAFYQVVDNKVFRLLLFLAAIPVVATFVFGFTDDGIVILFGLDIIRYESFGVQPSETVGVGEAAIQWVQGKWTDVVLDNYGVLFCLAATAFFIPNMLEKGTADTIFSKPVSRLLLLLARYVSGVLFVFLLVSVMIVGMHLGFLANSGYSDPGFLWSILTLTYTFALVHGVSTVVAIFTRSSITAILCTLIFSFATTSVHCVWMFAEQGTEQRLMKAAAKGEEAQENDEDETSGFMETFFDGVKAAHYVLPKTNDSDYLMKKLRRTIAGTPGALNDDSGGLLVSHHPFSSSDSEVRFAQEFDDSPIRFKVAWTEEAEDGSIRARVSIDRIDRDHEFSADGTELGPKRPKRLRAKVATDEALDAISSSPDVVVPPERVREKIALQTAYQITWTTGEQDSRRLHQRAFLPFRNSIYVLDFEQDSRRAGVDEWDAEVRAFLNGLGFPSYQAAVAEMDPTKSSAWYESKFDWDAPLKFNIFFSIGSSLAFLALMLVISWLRLKRIDF